LLVNFFRDFKIKAYILPLSEETVGEDSPFDWFLQGDNAKDQADCSQKLPGKHKEEADEAAFLPIDDELLEYCIHGYRQF